MNDLDTVTVPPTIAEIPTTTTPETGPKTGPTSAPSTLPPTASELLAELAGLGLTVDELSTEIALLPEPIAAVLDADGREVWSRLGGGGARERLIRRAADRRYRRAVQDGRRREREAAAARYIDALCRLPHLPADQKVAGRLDLEQARSAYHALRAR